MKTIDTLVFDMMQVVEGLGGWDTTVTKFMAEGIANIAEDRFSKPQEVRTHLSPSMIGHPCWRNTWYKINTPHDVEKLDAEILGTFFYGDLLEYVTIALAIAAGHKVTGLQEKLDIHGLPGSGDCVIDGVVVDVKSASMMSFVKFKKHQLKGYNKFDKKKSTNVWVPAKEVDSFGYISQLSSYLYGYRNNPAVVYKNKAAFLVVRKDRFVVCLDMYDLTEEVANKEKEVDGIRDITAGPIPPRGFSPVSDGASGNMMLGTVCKYCGFKAKCYPDLRTFIYAAGPRYLTTVVKRPQEHIKEIK